MKLSEFIEKYGDKKIDETELSKIIVGEEKYLWKLRGNNQENFGIGFYFNFDTKNRIWFVTDKSQMSKIKTQFTEKEFVEWKKNSTLKVCL